MNRIISAILIFAFSLTAHPQVSGPFYGPVVGAAASNPCSPFTDPFTGSGVLNPTYWTQTTATTMWVVPVGTINQVSGLAEVSGSSGGLASITGCSGFSTTAQTITAALSSITTSYPGSGICLNMTVSGNAVCYLPFATYYGYLSTFTASGGTATYNTGTYNLSSGSTCSSAASGDVFTLQESGTTYTVTDVTRSLACGSATVPGFSGSGYPGIEILGQGIGTSFTVGPVTASSP